MILEILIAVAIIVALLLLLGVSLQTILVAAGVIVLSLIALAMASIVLFFLLSDLLLPFRKPVKGTFLRVDDSGRMDHAVYRVGDTEYTCSFPAESFGRKRIYQPEKDYLLLIPRFGSRKTAFDRHSLFILALGTVVSVLFVFLLTFGIAYLRTLF